MIDFLRSLNKLLAEIFVLACPIQFLILSHFHIYIVEWDIALQMGIIVAIMGIVTRQWLLTVFSIVAAYALFLISWILGVLIELFGSVNFFLAKKCASGYKIFIDNRKGIRNAFRNRNKGSRLYT